MKNLAGDRACDRTIAQELERARIEFVRLNQPSGEPLSRLRGKLGPIAFSRGWACWIAEGPTPLAVARDLYADPIGRCDVRVQGNSDSTPPEAPWVRWYTADGVRVYPVEHRAEFLHMREKWPHLLETTAPVVFHDEPQAIGAAGYIDLYHIDSEDGLQTFTRTLRRHSIDQLTRPSWWDCHHPATMHRDAAQVTTTKTRLPQRERATLWDGDTLELDLDD